MVEAMSTPTTVVLHVDPACPWAWLTSRWLAEVERVRPVRVVTRLFDLAEINREADQADERMQRSHSAGERALRVLVEVRRRGGSEAMAAAYTEIGEAYHERNQPLGELSTLRGALEAAGLDPGIADAALEDDSTYTELLEEHHQACQGECFGVPTISVDGGRGIFGPVVDRRVTGEEAGELWDHVAWLLGRGYFFELKRERTGKADVGRYRVQMQGEAQPARRAGVGSGQ
jgi:predicted DsbA family dithiol-disulfide isomerase